MQDVATWAVMADRTRFAVGMYVEAIGLLLLLVFFAWMCDTLWQGGAPAWLVALAFGAGLFYVGGGILINGIWSAVVDASARGLDAQTLDGIRTVASSTYAAIQPVFALASLTIGAAALTSRALPAWLGWAAIAIALLVFIPISLTGGGIAGALVSLWAAVVGARQLTLLRRRSSQAIATSRG
jgi:hypothetical protein